MPGAVLFVDEAHWPYDPTGRSYQEAVDEITLLTEEEYRNKLVVVFAGYGGQRQVAGPQPRFESRVSDIIDFPDFTAKDAAAIAANLLKRKRLGRVGTDILVEEAQKS